MSKPNFEAGPTWAFYPAAFASACLAMSAHAQLRHRRLLPRRRRTRLQTSPACPFSTTPIQRGTITNWRAHIDLLNTAARLCPSSFGRVVQDRGSAGQRTVYDNIVHSDGAADWHCGFNSRFCSQQSRAGVLGPGPIMRLRGSLWVPPKVSLRAFKACLAFRACRHALRAATRTAR